MGLKRYSFACCIACKQIELCEGLSLFAAFFLQSFLIMDLFNCKYMERAENQLLFFPITFYFQRFTDSVVFSDFVSFVPLLPKEKQKSKIRSHIRVAVFPVYGSIFQIGKMRDWVQVHGLSQKWISGQHLWCFQSLAFTGLFIEAKELYQAPDLV